jgi:hypothetical protein
MNLKQLNQDIKYLCSCNCSFGGTVPGPTSKITKRANRPARLTSNVKLPSGAKQLEEPSIDDNAIPRAQMVKVFENPTHQNDYHLTKLPQSIKDLYFPEKVVVNPFDVSFTDFLFYAEWTLPPLSTVVVVGDVHGDIQGLKNLFAHWHVQGFLLDDGSLRPDVFVVSTGDLVDYVYGALHVVYAFTLLRKRNPDQVMLLTGNHEGSTAKFTAGREFLTQELEDNGVGYLFVDNLPKIGPSLLGLRFDNDDGFYFMMHGMHPVVIDGDDFAVWPLHKQIPVRLDYLNGTDAHRPNYTAATQWNDLGTEENIELNAPSERGIPFCVGLGMYHLHGIMNALNIKMYIRGHQDYCPTQRGMFHENCGRTIAVELASSARTGNKELVCRSVKKEWCVFESTEPVVGLPTPQNMSRRIYTTSMADKKRASDAPCGGYVLVQDIGPAPPQAFGRNKR